MRIDIITVLPELIQSPFNHSIIKRGVREGPGRNPYTQLT